MNFNCLEFLTEYLRCYRDPGSGDLAFDNPNCPLHGESSRHTEDIDENDGEGAAEIEFCAAEARPEPGVPGAKAEEDYRLTLLASFGACITSLEAPENLCDIDGPRWQEIESLYGRLHSLVDAVVSGPTALPEMTDAEHSRAGASIGRYLGNPCTCSSPRSGPGSRCRGVDALGLGWHCVETKERGRAGAFDPEFQPPARPEEI